MRFALDDQIAAEPEVVARIVSREMPCLQRLTAELARLHHTDPTLRTAAPGPGGPP
jgi:hypothetical protein